MRGVTASMALEILFYADSRGHQPVLEWMEELKEKEPHTFRRMFYLLQWLEENGESLRAGKIKRKDIKRLTGTNDIWQIRVDENRVLYFYYGQDSIVLTNQFKKKKNKTPKKEIIRAENRKKSWIERNS